LQAVPELVARQRAVATAAVNPIWGNPRQERQRRLRRLAFVWIR